LNSRLYIHSAEWPLECGFVIPNSTVRVCAAEMLPDPPPIPGKTKPIPSAKAQSTLTLRAQNEIEHLVEAAGEDKMLPVAVLSGNLQIVTQFFDADFLVGQAVVRVFYDGKLGSMDKIGSDSTTDAAAAGGSS